MHAEGILITIADATSIALSIKLHSIPTVNYAHRKNCFYDGTVHLPSQKHICCAVQVDGRSVLDIETIKKV